MRTLELPMKRRVLLLTVLAATVAAPVARADGDPASDWLLTYQVFYPYYASAPKSAVKALQTTVADANKRGYTIRVAVITSPYDLGSLTSLWGKSEPYCRFLALELSFAYRGRLLVIMPSGFGYVEKTVLPRGGGGVVKNDPAALALARTVPIGKGTAGLLLSAQQAVRRLAARAGYPLPNVSASSSGSGSGSDTLVIAIAAAVGAVLVAGVEFARRARSRRKVLLSAQRRGRE